jgi:hypothetical protein
MDTIFNNTNYLFILANQGAGGHRLGRIISCFNNVYWYSSKHNGEHPWDVFLDNTIAGKDISKYHYDRTLGNKTVPVLGERILKWWDSEDWDKFYNTTWLTEFKKITFPDNMIIHWVLHDTPAELHKKFPQAKIISLIDTDIELVTDRYMQTTAKFPCAINHFNLKPSYKNQYAHYVDELVNPTEQQLWFQINKNSTETDYINCIKENLTLLNNVRQSYVNKNYLTVTWGTLDIDILKSFLNSDKIDQSYKRLLN